MYWRNSPSKKSAKQNAVTKLLEMLSTRYVFLEEIEEKSLTPESKIFKLSDEISKESLQKWTNACERCFQRGHLAHIDLNDVKFLMIIELEC